MRKTGGPVLLIHFCGVLMGPRGTWYSTGFVPWLGNVFVGTPIPFGATTLWSDGLRKPNKESEQWRWQHGVQSSERPVVLKSYLLQLCMPLKPKFPAIGQVWMILMFICFSFLTKITLLLLLLFLFDFSFCVATCVCEPMKIVQLHGKASLLCLYIECMYIYIYVYIYQSPPIAW